MDPIRITNVFLRQKPHSKKFVVEEKIDDGINAELINQLDSTSFLKYCGIEKITAIEGDSITYTIPPISDKFPVAPRTQEEFEKFLDLAISATKALSVIHQLDHCFGVFHADRFLVSQEGQLVIIGLGMVRKDYGDIDLSGFQTSDFSYLAPEFSSRTNGIPEKWADFYSLGTLLHYWLTGKHFVDGQDRQEMLHQHLIKNYDKEATPALWNDTGIFQIISNLVSKNPEDRYRSAHGVIKDLTNLQFHNSKGEFSDKIEISRDYNPGVLNLNKAFYEREEPLNQLLAIYEKVKKGGSAIVFVESSEGMGKTSLGEAFLSKISESNTLCNIGGFDQSNSSPYLVWQRAFKNIAKRIFLKSSQSHVEIRKIFRKGLGSDLSLLFDILPDLKDLTGSMDPPEPLDPVETQNRFINVFSRYCRTLDNIGLRRVLFLDDWQWCDLPSLKIVEHLIKSSVPRLMFVLSYNAKEIHKDHPLLRFQNELKNSPKYFSIISLKPLSPAGTNRMVSDILSENEGDVRELAGLIYKKTYGNPYYIKHFLRSLHDNQTLYFDQSTKRWRCNLDQVKLLEVTENVVTIEEKQLELQSFQAQNLLKVAAYNDGRFDIPLLARISGYSADIIRLLLDVLVHAGLLSTIEGPKGTYSFIHKRIQQAALSLVIPNFQYSPEELHHMIALYRLQEYSIDKSLELNQLMYHLQESKNLLSRKTSDEALEYIVKAGNLANESNAPQTAKSYFNLGIDLIERFDLKRFEYELHKGLTTAFLLLNDIDEGRKYAKLTKKLAYKQKLGRIEIILLTMKFYEAYTYYEDNISAGLEALQICGKPIRATGSGNEIASLINREYEIFISFTNGKELQQIIPQELMEGYSERIYMDILANMITSAHFTNQELYSLVVLKMVNHSFKFGLSESTPLAFVCLGSLLISKYTSYELGLKVGELGLDLLEKVKSDKYGTRTVSSFHLLLSHFRESYEIIHAKLEEGISSCTDMGDSMCTNYLYYVKVRNQFLSGTVLPEALKQCEVALELMSQNNCDGFMAQMSLIKSGVLLLQNNPSTEDELADSKAINLLIEKKHFSALVNHNVFRSWVYCLKRNYVKAYDLLQSNEEFISYATSQPNVFRHHVLKSVCELMLVKSPRKKDLKIIEDRQNSLRGWADQNPTNFRAEFTMVEFILACRRNAYPLAVEKIEEALKWSEKGNLRAIQAMLYDLGSRLLPNKEYGFMKKHLKSAAIEAYGNWGVNTKGANREVASKKVLSTDSRHISFDRQSLIKATQAISAEVNRDALVQRLLNIVMENAGADKGALVLMKDNVPYVQAVIVGENHKDNIFKEAELASFIGLPTNLIEHVIYSKKEFSIDNVNQFSTNKDGYFRSNQICSLILLPLVKQNDLVGVLYLENSQVSGLFTEGDLEVLRVIASQAAISITNSILYEQAMSLNKELAASQEELGKMNLILEERIKERTKHLRHEIEMRKEAERGLLFAKNDADNANKAKSQFLANMSHEIRTPLNAIVGFAQILMNQSQALQLTYKFKRYLNNIHQSAESLSEIINDILDLSKIEAGKMTLKKEDMDLKQMVMSVFRIHKSLGKTRNVTLVCDWETGTPHYIHSDRSKLKQILMNILGNAIKFTPPDKEVRLRVKREGSLLCFSVIDEGIGIPEGQLQKIFNPFVQADAGINRKYGGTGLGLAITKRLVEILQGSIDVQSKVQEGTSFTICIPYEKASMDKTEMPEILFANFNIPESSKILVVEDNTMNQEMIRALFAELGAEILLASNGREGIKITRQYKPDIIFMDIHMPHLDGFETVNRIRTFNEEVPIIGLSADAFKEHQEAAIKAGFSDYLTKPIQMTLLIQVLRQYLIKDRVNANGCDSPLSDQQRRQRDKALQSLRVLPIFETEKLVAAAEPLNSLLSPLVFNKLEEAIYSGDDLVLQDILSNSLDEQ